MGDSHIIVIDNMAEISMPAIDAAHAIKIEPGRYSMAFIEVLDSMTNKVTSLPKLEGLRLIDVTPERYSIVLSKRDADGAPQDPILIQNDELR